MKCSSRTDLKNYSLRKLGSPALQINVTPEQVDDRIDEAIEKFWNFHGDGSIREYISYTLEDIDFERKYLIVSDHILSVLRILPIGNKYSSLNLEYTQFMNGLINNEVASAGTSISMSSYVIDEQYMSLFNTYFSEDKTLRFNQNFNRIYIDSDWETFSVNDVLVLECYQLADPEEYRGVYNNLWLKNYTTALIKQQWGQNLLKYNNFVLPGGVSVDGRSIYADALAEIEKLDAELSTTYSLPIDFFTG